MVVAIVVFSVSVCFMAAFAVIQARGVYRVSLIR
jgi:hypothetical protein